jgi:hypothetical protein
LQVEVALVVAILLITVQVVGAEAEDFVHLLQQQVEAEA